MDIMDTINNVLKENAPVEFLHQEEVFNEDYWKTVNNFHKTNRYHRLVNWDRTGLFQTESAIGCEGYEEDRECDCLIALQNQSFSHTCTLWEECTICSEEEHPQEPGILCNCANFHQPGLHRHITENDIEYGPSLLMWFNPGMSVDTTLRCSSCMDGTQCYNSYNNLLWCDCDCHHISGQKHNPLGVFN